MRTDHRIPCGDSEIAAWLYQPDTTTGEAACVVLGNGFSLTRHDGLEAFAEAFANAGVAALVIDWRHFGDSGGEPRQRFRMALQREDRAAAVAWARAQEGIDPDRIVLWGFSMAGGLAVQSAVADPRIAALLLLCPFLDGFDRVRRTPVGISARILPKALMDNTGRHVTVPVTAPPGQFGAMPFPGEHAGFLAATPPDSPWRNDVSPGLFTGLAFFAPVRLAAKVGVPVWLGLGERDITVSKRAIEKFAAKAPQAVLRRYAQHDHFTPLVPSAAKVIAASQVAFLREIGLVDAPSVGGP